MATNEQLQSAAGLALPGHNLADDTIDQIRYLIPAVQASGASVSIMFPATIHPDGTGYFTVHICEIENHEDVVSSHYVGRSAVNVADVIAAAVGRYWGIDDAE